MVRYKRFSFVWIETSEVRFLPAGIAIMAVQVYTDTVFYCVKIQTSIAQLTRKTKRFFSKTPVINYMQIKEYGPIILFVQSLPLESFHYFESVACRM